MPDLQRQRLISWPMNAHQDFSPSQANEPTAQTLPINPAHPKPSTCSLLAIAFPKLRFFYCFRMNSISGHWSLPQFITFVQISTDKVKWQPENWVGSSVHTIWWWTRPMVNDQWELQWLANIFELLFFRLHYKGYHLGSSFWQLLLAGPSDRVVYGSQQNYGCAIINLDDQIHNKAPD